MHNQWSSDVSFIAPSCSHDSVLCFRLFGLFSCFALNTLICVNSLELATSFLLRFVIYLLFDYYLLFLFIKFYQSNQSTMNPENNAFDMLPLQQALEEEVPVQPLVPPNDFAAREPKLPDVSKFNGNPKNSLHRHSILSSYSS